MNALRRTIRGLVIHDRKVLLVTGHSADFYWTPGGGVEPGESPEATLRREIREELGVEVRTLSWYAQHTYNHQQVESYLIEVEGEVTTGNEITGTAWFSTKSSIKTSDGFKKSVLPQLVADDLID